MRGARPLAGVVGSTPMQLKADVSTYEALLELKIALDVEEDCAFEGNGEVLVRVTLEDGGHAQLRLGRSFLLSGELAERLAEVPGIANVELAPLRSKASLRLVA